MPKQDPVSVWEQDGDRDMVYSFFHQSEVEGDVMERIKEQALVKFARNQEKEKLGLLPPEKPGPELLTGPVRIGQLIMSLWWRWRWRLVIPVAGLVLLVLIGYAGPSAQPIGLHLGAQAQIPSGSGRQSSQSVAAAAAPSAAVGGAPQTSVAAKSTASGAMNANAATQIVPTTGGGPQTSFTSLSVSADNGTAGQPVAPPAAGSAAAYEAAIARKLIQTMQATIQVENVPNTMQQITQEAGKLGGYVVDSDQSSSGADANAYGNLTVKIPADKLPAFQTGITAWGKILNQHLSGNDITAQYTDTEIRLNNWKAEEQRYLDILKQAKTVEDILKVESPLANVRQQIEQLEGQIKLWNNQVDYATVTLQLQTKPNLIIKVNNSWQPVSWETTVKAGRDAVLKTISSIWNALNYAMVGLGYALPFIVLGLLSWGTYRLWRKRKA